MTRLEMRFRVVILVALVCLALGAFGVADAAPVSPTLIVDVATGQDRAGCGGSGWPCETIGYAYTANEGLAPTIYVTPGRYVETLEFDHDVTLIGGYALSEARPLKGTETIIDADSAGTVIDVRDAAVTLESLTLTGGSGFNGGGMDIRDSTVTIQFCAITGNTATYGAGIFVGDEQTGVSIYGSRITENTAAQTGGGIYLYEGAMVLWDSTLSNNVVVNGAGGGIAMEGGDLALSRCVASGNTAHGGGGLANLQGGAEFDAHHSLVTGNSVESGQGNVLWSENSTAVVAYSTVADNALGARDAVVQINSALASVGSIWWGNDDNFSDVSDLATWDITYCAVEGGWAGAGNIDADPMFVAQEDYHLLGGSPCVDAAPAIGGCVEDLDRVARPQDGDGDGIAAPNMGCYETVAWRLYLPTMR